MPRRARSARRDCPRPFRSSIRSDAAAGTVYGMELREAFTTALPTPDWARVARERIVVALIDLHDWQPWLSDAQALIDPPEASRVRRRVKAADRDALALAYALHRLLLGAILDLDPADVPLGRDAQGCPRLENGTLSTSLSHAGGFAALAASGAGAVGVDLEPVTRASVLPEIAERVCDAGETAALAGLAAPAYGAALLALWVRKEALLKAAGVGLSREMSSFPAPEETVLPLSAVPGETTRIRMLDAGPQCVAAVAGPPRLAVDSAWLRPWRG